MRLENLRHFMELPFNIGEAPFTTPFDRYESFEAWMRINRHLNINPNAHSTIEGINFYTFRELPFWLVVRLP
ncbi:hypothetical protein VKT23_009680 [Stygiomarasmius scandens]|uniref:Uncharacterized protein n=1 Tax=Marasmiellus scandens TaxID=2682957 RepID=A0ABR1IMC4_9AGAR